MARWPSSHLNSTSPQLTPEITLCARHCPPFPFLDPSSALNLTPSLPSKITAMAASVASKRLFHEYKNLTNDPPEGITAGPVSEDDLFVWEALIQGPEGTPFEGGIFPAELKFPKDYPLAPPSMKFVCEMWHPNGKPLISPSRTSERCDCCEGEGLGDSTE